MGTLHYGASRTSLHMEDRALAHLQVVITTKLRRNEGFLIQWERPHDSGSGRGGFWVHPNCDLAYEYEAALDAALDPEELERMMMAASGTGGVRVTADDTDGNVGSISDRRNRERVA